MLLLDFLFRYVTLLWGGELYAKVEPAGWLRVREIVACRCAFILTDAELWKLAVAGVHWLQRIASVIGAALWLWAYSTALQSLFLCCDQLTAALHGLVYLKYVLTVKSLHDDNSCWLWCSSVSSFLFSTDLFVKAVVLSLPPGCYRCAWVFFSMVLLENDTSSSDKIVSDFLAAVIASLEAAREPHNEAQHGKQVKSRK